MELSVIRIGNSKGIRLKRDLLRKYNITDAVEVILQEDCIIIKPIGGMQQTKEAEKAIELPKDK